MNERPEKSLRFFCLMHCVSIIITASRNYKTKLTQVQQKMYFCFMYECVRKIVHPNEIYILTVKLSQQSTVCYTTVNFVCKSSSYTSYLSVDAYLHVLLTRLLSIHFKEDVDEAGMCDLMSITL